MAVNRTERAAARRDPSPRGTAVLHRRTILAVATASFVLAPTTGAFADEAESWVLEVDGVATVSHSEAGAATGLSVLGNQVAGQRGQGSSSAASTKDLGVPTDAAEATVLGSSVSGRSSSADAARVSVGGGQLEASALSSRQDGSSASSSALRVSGGGQGVGVGTSRTTAEDGSAAVLELGDEQIATHDQLGGVLCGLDASPLVALEALCVRAIAGTGGTSGTGAGVLPGLDVLPGDDTLGGLSLLGSNTLAGTGSVPPGDGPGPDGPNPGPSGGPLGPKGGTVGGAGGGAAEGAGGVGRDGSLLGALARTGGGTATIGVALLGLAVLAERLRRRGLVAAG